MHTNNSNLNLEAVALVGAPNSGKTTLYNWLTNSKFKTVNYPGATVEYAIGMTNSRLGEPFLSMDTPGTYSLFPKSADEEVTLKALFNEHNFGRIQKAVVVVDGTQLERHLLLAQQMKEAHFSFILVVTMSDLLKKNKVHMEVPLLEKAFGAPVVLFDGISGAGLEEVIEKVRRLPNRLPKKLTHWTEKELHSKSTNIKELTDSVFGNTSKVNAIYNSAERLDKVLLHPTLGVLIFFAIMSLLFSSIFWMAKPFMEIVDRGFSLGVDKILDIGQGTLLADFMGHGLVASLGSVMVFIPQIFILFVGIGILESTGYLARAATLIDKPFSKLGLSGRSFVPILSGFACAVPAIMATRNISTRRERLITNLVIPLMTCSARLPVYALLLSFLFKDDAPWKPGVALAAIYMFSLVLGSFAAMILNRMIARKEKSFFMMELPLYRMPRLKILLSHSMNRTKAYALKAGPMIFTFAVLIWVGTTFPNYNATSAQQKLESSYLAHIGRSFEPVLAPMAVDWRVGVGLLSAFAARETFVSSLAIVFNITDEKEESQSESLLKAMSLAKNPTGGTLFTVASVLGLIVFFMIAMQCMSTFSISIRENGSMAYALAQLVGYNILAYVVASGVVLLLHSVGVA